MRRHVLPSLFATLLAGIPATTAAAPYPNTGNFGVPFSTSEDWYRQCMRVEKQAASRPAAAAPADCEASELYYRKRSQAVTSQAEWDQVRACAVAHDNNNVLMMLYANGLGVPRDTDIAIHHACILEFAAKAEMTHRIAHLAAGVPANVVFDQCDDVTSGRMGAVCAEIRESQDRRVRGARLKRMAATLPAPARAAFVRLRGAAEHYASAAGAETDMRGTAAPAFVIQREDKIREEFMQAALDAAGGRLPAASAQDAAARDRDLNEAYRALMAAPSPQQDWPGRLGDTTIERKDVRAAERAWIAYRDAFAAFAAQLRPAAPPATVNALLTGQRLATLKALARAL